MKAVQNLSLVRMMAAGLFLMMIAGCVQQVTVDEAEVAVQQESERLASELEAMERDLAALYLGEKITHPPRGVDRLRVDQINGLLAGRYAIDAGNYAEGIEKLEVLLQTELNTNEQGDAWGLIAYGYYMAGDFDASIEAWNTLLDIEPIKMNVEQRALRALYQLYFRQRRLEETVTVIDRLLVLNGELVPELTHAKAMALFELKDWDAVLKNISASEEVARQKEQPVLRRWLIHKYGAYVELGDTALAAAVLVEIKDNYTDDGEYERLLALRPGEMRVLTGEPGGKKPRPKLISHVAPVYPEEAIGNGLVGWVMLLFTVDETGDVRNPVVVENCAAVNEGDKPKCAHSPNNIFDQAALSAIRQSKYEPVVIDGVATTGQALTRVEFWLNPITNN